MDNNIYISFYTVPNPYIPCVNYIRRTEKKFSNFYIVDYKGVAICIFSSTCFKISCGSVLRISLYMIRNKLPLNLCTSHVTKGSINIKSLVGKERPISLHGLDGLIFLPPII